MFNAEREREIFRNYFLTVFVCFFGDWNRFGNYFPIFVYF